MSAKGNYESELDMSMEVLLLGFTHFVHDIYATKNGFGNRMQLDGTI
jgi:hypothetical protein